MFEVENITVCYGKKQILHDVNIQISKGRVVCLLGPNGSGKTTLFKALMGMLPLTAGTIKLDGKAINTYNSKDFAKKVGYVPQLHIPTFPFTVIDIVCTGRIAHNTIFSGCTVEDSEIADTMLDRLGIYKLRDKVYTEISGGERQMVLIARAMAQQPEFIIMDEPTAHLDYGNQIRTIERISRMTNEKMGVIFTTHNPEHPLHCADDVIALNNGTIEGIGYPQNIISSGMIRRLYDVDVVIDKKRIYHESCM
jgi:iron complex transport system ATP-binding protein